jgi:hypothetical protein
MIYTVEMSKGPSIRIDEDDLVKIKANINESLIAVKQGIINPSFMISIIPTNEPDTKIKQIYEHRENRVVVTGSKEVKVLADIMNINNTKRLTDGKEN